jgi:hypothetical protein
VATEKRNTSKSRKAVSKEPSRELPPNEQLKRYADEAYGDTDVPARQRSNSQTMDEKKHSRAEHSRGRRSR